MNASRYSIHLSLIGMAALWGGSWPLGKVVAQAMPPLAASSLRFILASLVLVVWLYRSGRMKGLLALNIRQLVVMGCA
jgi:drug/metabolite transporter (DMT)-like permease